MSTNKRKVAKKSNKRKYVVVYATVVAEGIGASIGGEAAHDDGREFINFPVNLLHSDFFPLFNQYCLHLSNCGNSLRGSAPLNSPLQ